MTRRPFDLSLYLVADPHAIGGRGLEEVVSAAVRGGVTMVQLRDKTATVGAMVEHGRILKGLLEPLGIPLIINDRVEVARDIGADGVHLGQDDMALAAARRLLGPDALIGASVGTPEELIATDLSVVDYVGIGPVFAARSKQDAGAAIGIEGLRAMRSLIDRPIVAIGGITAEWATAVLGTGVDGIAVVSAICKADRPDAAARTLRHAR